MKGNAPEDAEITAQLGRILGSSEFQRSRRLTQLLEYLVNETLEGRQGGIKATTIAMELYGRDASFDQQRDNIVRVEAGRLRRHLQGYYQEQGQDDPVRIEVPKGRYRPAFSYQKAPVSDPDTRPLPDKPETADGRHDRKLLNLTAALAVGTLLLLLWTQFWQAPEVTPIESEDSVFASETQGQMSRPFLMVMPFTSLSTDEATGRAAVGLVESLITNLAKLSSLSVMAHASILNLEGSDGSSSLVAKQQKLGVSHLLRGSVKRDADAILVNAQLAELAAGEILWAERYRLPLGAETGIEEELALRIATELSVQIQPDERARISESHSASPEAWVLYRQGLVMLIPPNDMTRIHTARGLFHRAQELDPGFAGGYAGESFSHSITVLFMKAASPARELEQALLLAERAIEADPGFAMGYATLSFAQLFTNGTESALRNAKQAVSIQPGDAFAQFILGMNLIIAGQAREAIPVLKGAQRLDPLEVRTPYLNVLAIAYYSAGSYREAAATMEYNRERGGPQGPHMSVFLAASYAALDRDQEAQELLLSVIENYPDFPIRDWLAHWLSNSNQLEHTMKLLASVGLG